MTIMLVSVVKPEVFGRGYHDTQNTQNTLPLINFFLSSKLFFSPLNSSSLLFFSPLNSSSLLSTLPLSSSSLL